MNIKDFAAAIADELCSRGITREEAKKHTLTLIKTLTEDDVREITEYKSNADFAELSDSLAELIIKKRKKRETAGEADMPAVKSDGSAKVADISDIGATRSFDLVQHRTAVDDTDMTQTTVGTPVQTGEDTVPQEIYLEEGTAIREKVVLTPRGRGFFIAIAVLTSPLWISLAAFALAIFGLSIAALCVLIGASLCAVFLETACGGVLTLVGLIWGIAQIFTAHIGIGIYEMGLGVVIGGVALALGILIYNFAVVVLPRFLRHLISFEGYCLRRVGPMLDRMREECNRL